MHRHPSWKGLVKLHRFSSPSFPPFFSSCVLNVKQGLLRSKYLITEEESGHLPVSGAGIMKYGKEQVTLGEVMGQKRRVLWFGEACSANTYGGVPLSEI